MSERDTPYDLVFRRGRIDFEGERFPAVRAEAEQRGVPLDDPERFVMLGSVGALIREMVLDEAAADDTGEVWQALPAEAVAQMGALLFHAFRFGHTGGRVHPIDEETARALAAEPAREGAARASSAQSGDRGAAPITAPAAAGYVQLPRNLFWARAGESDAAEPLDGFFWSLGERRFDVLLALGVRARRPGFTAIPIGIELDAPGAPPSWADAKARDTGADFTNILPGGELDRLLGITSAAEALRLAALCLRHLQARNDR